MGFKPRQENILKRFATVVLVKGGEKCTSLRKNIVTSGGKSALKDVDEGGRSVLNAVWVDVGDCIHGKALGSLQSCLIGRWRTQPVPYPRSEEVEAWFRDAWGLNEEAMLTVLNDDLVLLEFNSPENAKWVLESGKRNFKGGVLQLDWWSPESGCTRSKGCLQEAWIRVVGLPLHLWTPEILRKLGDACGGFVAADEVTEKKKEVKWARMLIKTEGKSRPSTVNILEGPRSYELQIWWEIPPWVIGVYPVVSRIAGKNQKEEGEAVVRAVKRVEIPSQSCDDEGQRLQDWESKKKSGTGLGGAEKVNSASGDLMQNRGGAYVEGGGNKRAGSGCLGEGTTKQTELSVGPNSRLNGSEFFGPIPNRSGSSIGQRVGSGLYKASKWRQRHRASVGMDRLGGLTGPVSAGPKQAGPPNGPWISKEGVRGNRGLEKVLNEARDGPKGILYCSKVEKRLGDGGSRLGTVCSLDPLADPAWICARDPLLYAQEGRLRPGGMSSFESSWEEGVGAVSPDCPLMGFSHQVQGEEGCPASRSLALVEVASRWPEEDDPEASTVHAIGSRFETVPSADFSSSIFYVFGRPLLSGGSSGLGDENEALGEMEPLRVVSADGWEWGKEIVDVPKEGGQTAVGIGFQSEESTMGSLKCRGYNTCEDSCLIKFSEFLGVTMTGFEKEILELLRKMDGRQHGDKRKGDPVETRCERELRKLECTINYNGKGQIRGGRDRGNFLLKLK